MDEFRNIFKDLPQNNKLIKGIEFQTEDYFTGEAEGEEDLLKGKKKGKKQKSKIQKRKGRKKREGLAYLLKANVE